MARAHAFPNVLGGLLALVLTPAFWPGGVSAATEERDLYCEGVRGTALWGQCTRAVDNGCHESEFAHPRCAQWAEQYEDQTGFTPPWVVCGGDGVCTVFMSSSHFNGDLDGLEGANEKCNVLALDAGLEGTYAAMLSTDASNDPESLFTRAQVPYRSVGELQNTGPQVAPDWDDFTSDNLQSLPLINEKGGVCASPGGQCPFWASTGRFFTYDGRPTCLKWTSGDGSEIPPGGGETTFIVGRLDTWGETGTVTCAATRFLLCVEQ